MSIVGVAVLWPLVAAERMQARTVDAVMLHLLAGEGGAIGLASTAGGLLQSVCVAAAGGALVVGPASFQIVLSIDVGHGVDAKL